MSGPDQSTRRFEAAVIGSDHGFPLPWPPVEWAKILDVSCGEGNGPGLEWSQTDT